MLKSFKRITTKLSMLVIALLAFAPMVSAASVVTVTGDTAAGENQPGWLFNRDASTATPYEFNQDQASIGAGSLYVEPISSNAADKFVGENFLLTPIADVNSISYDFLIGSGGEASDANHFYMNVYANFGASDPEKFYDCRYNVVPTSGSLTDFTTVEFDPTLAYPVTQSGTSPETCPSVPAEMDDLSSGSTIRVFALNVGDTSTNDEGLDGYLDNVVVDTSGDVTTYDFEPVIALSGKEDCKDGGWMASNSPTYKNQGDCVSAFASEGKAKGNPVANFFRNLF
jgi:hypothetical protein